MLAYVSKLGLLGKSSSLETVFAQLFKCILPFYSMSGFIFFWNFCWLICSIEEDGMILMTAALTK